MYDYHKLIHISIVTMFYLLNFSTLHANAYEALGQENDINRELGKGFKLKSRVRQHSYRKEYIWLIIKEIWHDILEISTKKNQFLAWVHNWQGNYLS